MLLVVYYSLSGKTAAPANCLAEKAGADCRRIEDVKPRRGVLSAANTGKGSPDGQLIFRGH